MTRSYRDYWQSIRGEKLATLIRGCAFIPLLAIMETSGQPIGWPSPVVVSPTAVLLWGYAGFVLLTSVLLIIPAVGSHMRFAAVIDVLLLLSLGAVSGQARAMFPLLCLPLLSSAAHQRPSTNLTVGVLAAVAYGGIVLLQLPHRDAAVDLSPIAAQMVFLLVSPWLVGNLTKLWSEVNAQAVAAAEARRDEAVQQTEAHRQQMRSFLTISAKLAETVNYRQVYTVALQEIAKVFPQGQTTLILLTTSNPKELKVEAVEPANPGLLGNVLTVGNGAIGRALSSSATPAIIEDLSKEPESATFPLFRSHHAAMVVPLRMKLKTFGVLMVLGDDARVFRADDLEILQGIANYVIVAIYNAQIQFELKQGNSKLLAKEKEVRKGIAEKLHDGPTQKVAQIAMNAGFLKRVVQHDPARLLEELDKFEQLAKIANGEMRMTLFELRPITLENQGLRAAIDEYVEKLKIRSGKTQILVRSRGAMDTGLEREVEGVIFDIVQESINNALKHAEAAHIRIILERQDDRYVVTVADDGKGFDLSAARDSADKRSSFGLRNFWERAELIGGTVEVDTAPGKGTTIRVIVPVHSG